MKLRYIVTVFIIGLIFGIYATFGNQALGQNSSVNTVDKWRYTTDGYVRSASTTAGLQVQGLANCDTVDTDASGKFACGTDDGGAGTSLLTNSGSNTYLNTGTNLKAPTFQATSTSASTFPYASSTAQTITDLFTGTIKSGTWNGTAIADAYVGALPRYIFDRVGKTGWDLDYTDSVDLSFDNSTRTFTITPTGATFEYWIQGTKYTSAATSTTITDTEGNWFIYFNSSGNIETSQTPWIIGNNDKAFIASGYWDATNNELITLDAELHSWVMDASVHRIMHSTFGTRYGDGLAVAINSANLDITGGSIYDEDIKISIVDDDTPDTEWEQQLTPAKVRTLYRTGASGYWRATTSSTTPVYLSGTDVYINTYTLGSWGLETVAANKYVAYWVIASGDVNSPVFMVPGQESGDTLAAARNGNQLADMDFSNLAIQEYRVIARVLVQKIAGAPYYSLAEVNDYRNVASEPTSSFTATDHGGLTGLLDDDHTQYAALAQNEAVTGTWAFYGSTTAPYYVATSTTLASTFPYASSTGYTVTDIWTGTVKTGTWNGSTIGIAYGGTNATSLGSHMLLGFNGTSIVATSSPTAAYYTATSTTASVLPNASTTNISVSNTSWLGTIRSALYQGATIGTAYGGTGATSYNSHQLLSFNGSTFVSTSTPVVGSINATSTTASSSLQAITATAFGIAAKFFVDATQAWFAVLTTFTQGIIAQTRLNIPNGAAVFTNNAGDIAIDTTSGQLRWNNGSATSTDAGFYTTGFSWASSTAITATTTVYLAPAAANLTVTKARCEVPTGTLNVSLYDGTNRANLINASSTIGTFTYTTNNAFTASESMRVDFGTPASSPTTIACRFTYTYDAD